MAEASRERGIAARTTPDSKRVSGWQNFLSSVHTHAFDHLAAYHQHLLKQRMSHMEALKRIARALACELYRFMKAQHQEAAQQKGKPWFLQ